MPTQFTPVTTVSPTAVNDTGRIDEAINLVQGLLQQRQQSADQAYQNTVRTRQLKGFAEEDAADKLAAEQNKRYLDLMQSKTKDYDTNAINSLILNNQITTKQGEALMPFAKDYVSDEDRTTAFAEGLKQIDISDPTQLAQLMNQTGVDESTARYYIGMMRKGAARGGSGGSGGSSDGKSGGSEASLLQGQAAAVNTKKAFRTVGMNYGNHRVTICGTDLAPQAQVLSDGVNYAKNLNGVFVKIKGKWYKASMKDGVMKANKIEIPADVLSSLNEGFTDFQKAHIQAQGKQTTVLSGSFNNRFTSK